MRIVILTGGTGSIALQRGLHAFLGQDLDGVSTKIIVNAYDNGLSTGSVRQVMHGQILGPSDVRKNQMTRLQLEDPGNPWLGFLGRRFTVDPLEARKHCHAEVDQLVRELETTGRPHDCRPLLIGAIEEYFASPLALKVAYDDFSLANVVYAGLARLNGNSLRAAGRRMAAALGIPDHVLLNDDRSLFLGAVTRSGKRINDEGDIVSWGNREDPIVDIVLTGPDGEEECPMLCLEAWQAIIEADLIILSSGTQWSSLIPTYASSGFSAAIRDSRARVVMVVNRTPDHDSPGQSISDIIRVLVPRYFDTGRLHLLADSRGHASMCSLDADASARVASFSSMELSDTSVPLEKHDPNRLARGIGHVFFREYLDSELFLFDYDDTLFGRENEYPRSSAFNIRGLAQLNAMTEVGICTGNTVQKLNLRAAGVETHKPLLVFADGGINRYSCRTTSLDGVMAQALEPETCVAPEVRLPTSGTYSAKQIMATLRRVGIPDSSIDNRGNALIAVRPIARESRRAALYMMRHLVHGSELEVRESGRTTLEIRSPALSKLAAIAHLRGKSRVPRQITYVGDECDTGNDREIQELAHAGDGVKCLHVSSPAQTGFFIATLLSYLQHGKR